MKRYKHNLSNYRLLTCDMGKLVPIGLQEALPGDTFQLASSAVIRVSPLAAPVMHPVNVRIHHFFVPHRLVWSEWEKFITGGPDGLGHPAGIPTINPGGAGTLADYMGIPTVATTVPVSTLPLSGVNQIWNEYFRDQDLETPRAETDWSVPNVAWGKDYFTSARPWTQKGPAVTVPIGGTAPVTGIGIPNPTWNWNLTNQAIRESSGATGSYANAAQVSSSSPAQAMLVQRKPGSTTDPNIFADLSQATGTSVNDFRRAFALQRYQEARARYGSRYTEYLRYLGVTPSDARLQRPEYLGGGTARLNFSEVLQTTEADGTPPAGRTSFGVGDLYGHGIAGLRHRRIRRFIEEHGYIHSFLSVRPRGMYMNGIERTWLRRSKEDFFQKELQEIGQQGILQNEIYAIGANPLGQVFGYQDRYREYKETPSLAVGEFRSTLNYWHMARDLPSNVTLNNTFVSCVPTKRIHNVQTNHALWCMVNNSVVARRLVKKGGSSRIL